jgi:Family of unknown function (DUF5989)
VRNHHGERRESAQEIERNDALGGRGRRSAHGRHCGPHARRVQSRDDEDIEPCKRGPRAAEAVPIFDLALAAHLLLSQSGVQPAAATGAEMKRFLVPIGIVIVILVGLALLTEGSAIAPFLYRNF